MFSCGEGGDGQDVCQEQHHAVPPLLLGSAAAFFIDLYRIICWALTPRSVGHVSSPAYMYQDALCINTWHQQDKKRIRIHVWSQQRNSDENTEGALCHDIPLQALYRANISNYHKCNLYPLPTVCTCTSWYVQLCRSVSSEQDSYNHLVSVKQIQPKWFLLPDVDFISLYR